MRRAVIRERDETMQGRAVGRTATLKRKNAHGGFYMELACLLLLKRNWPGEEELLQCDCTKQIIFLYRVSLFAKYFIGTSIHAHI